jgi:hypothetical protein
MSERILLVDIGNTRIKWATLRNARLGRQRALAYDGWTAADCGRRRRARRSRDSRCGKRTASLPDGVCQIGEAQGRRGDALW